IYYTLDGSDPRLPELANVRVSSTKLVSAGAAKRVLVPTGPVNDAWTSSVSFNDGSWLATSGLPGGVGYETGSGYEDRISLDLAAHMPGKQLGCYVRIPFELTGDVSRFQVLTLKMQYDDGFVAYLNGHEIFRAGFAGTPAWNVQANGNHEADTIESFDVSQALDVLKAGNNLLAIHGLNVSLSSSDFMMWAELEAKQVIRMDGSGGASETAMLYTDTIPLQENVLIKARALSGGMWSVLSEELFTIGPVSTGLDITEVMYHAQGDDDPNLEFIEIMNISTETINLKDIHFTEGVTFRFDSWDLPSEGFVLLVQDPEAFVSHYGANLPVAGAYQGKLSNGGERLTLADPSGQTIESFTYSDNWYRETDGQGHTLVRAYPGAQDGDDLSDATAWQLSAEWGGSPGEMDHASAPVALAVPPITTPPWSSHLSSIHRKPRLP
ncbi:lamin tail domain-containing protein, partial [Planctomycetota bacterium]